MPRPRAPPLRDRELVPRFVVERVLVLRDALAAPVERFAAGFFAAVERVEVEPVDFARVEAFRPPAAFARVEPVDALFRAPLLRDPPDDDEAVLISPSIVHLPDMTRCAASATASAMIDPSLVALDMTFVAAAEALSAASRPASRILRRAAGLALIAAAAAARPAASISLLIAALASLSIVSLREEEPEDVFFEDLAIT